MTTIGGVPAHPLVVHAVVVLLPLAALGSVLLLRPAWRQRFGVLILLVGLAGLAAVPAATITGTQLRDVISAGGPVSQPIMAHESAAGRLLPFAILFAVLLLVTVLASARAGSADGSMVWRRVAAGAAVLTVLAGVVVIGLTVWIGHLGSTAVWQGVVS
jgi:hypothetical protein